LALKILLKGAVDQSEEWFKRYRSIEEHHSKKDQAYRRRDVWVALGERGHIAGAVEATFGHIEKRGFAGARSWLSRR